MRVDGSIIAAMWLLILPAAATAQVAWDAPYLTPPQAQPGVGIYLAETAGGDLGAMTTWRDAASPHNLGWRLGIAEGADGKLNVYAGADASGPWRQASAELPPDIAWVGGFGAAVGDYLLVSIPFGITAGRTLVGEGAVRFTPYVSPRLVLDGSLGREHRDGTDADELDLDLTLDLGFDLALPDRWAVRFGATVGDREGLAFGVVFW